MSKIIHALKSGLKATLAPRNQVVLVCLLAFGPYLVGGLRTEQLGVYGCLSLMLFRAKLRNWSFAPSPIPIVVLLGSIPAVAVVVDLVGEDWQISAVGHPVPAIDNGVLPIAVIVLGALWLLAEEREVLIVRFCMTLVIMLSVNALLSILQTSSHGLIEVEVLRQLWTASGSLSVAELALQMGRVTGVFNQPAEAGIAYFIGVFAALYLMRTRPSHTWVPALGLPALLVGGLLAQTKIFYLVGIPLAMVSVVFLARSFKFISWISWSVLLGALVTMALDDLSYSRSFVNTEALTSLSGASAGRYGEDGVLGPYFKFVWMNSPFFGLGITYFGSYSDSEWLRVFGGAGLTGVAAFIAVLAILGCRLIRNRPSLDNQARWLAVSCYVCVIAASFGIPALSSNKSGTVLCLGLALTVCAQVRIRPLSQPLGPSIFLKRLPSNWWQRNQRE